MAPRPGSVNQQIADVKRRQARVEVRIQTFLTKIDDAITAGDKEELDTVAAQLECTATKWSEINDELNALLPANQRDDEENRQDDLDDNIVRYQRKASRLLEAKATAASGNPAYAPAIPKLKFATFTGEYADWPRWWTHFEAAVHQNSRLHAVDKFNLLKSYAGDRANDSISELDVTSDNYTTAIDLLKKRFERLDLIQDEHLAAIAALPPVEDNKDGRGLRHLYDKLLAHTASLESAGLDQSVFAPSIRPSIVRKLPFELQAEWRRMERNAACTFTDFLEFLEEAADVREFAARGASVKKPVSVKSKVPATSAGTTASTVAQLAAPVQQRSESSRQRRRCLFCGGTHFAVKCQVPTEKKKEQIERERRCNRCLGTNHQPAACRKAQPCRKCGDAHHTALCHGSRAAAAATTTSTSATPVTYAAATTLSASAPIYGTIFLKTATVIIDGPNGSHRAIAFVDDGSHRSYVRRELAEQLELPIEEQEDLAIGHFGAPRPGPIETLRRRSVTVRGTFPGAPPVALSLLDKEAICSVPSYARTELANQLWNQGRRLADDRFFGGHHPASEVDILIGADQIWEVCGATTIKGSGGVRAIDSKFGWLLLGPTIPRRPAECPATATTAAPTVVISALACAFESPLQLTWPSSARHEPGTKDVKDASSAPDETAPPAVGQLSPVSSGTGQPPPDEAVNEDFDLSAFWAIEHLGILSTETDQSDRLDKYEEDITRAADGRYCAPLPWKVDRWRLMDNRAMAEGRLASLMRRLRKQPELLTSYHREIQLWRQRGFIAPAKVSFTGPFTYLPHHPVVRHDKSTTKIRPVFDGSARTRDGPSLNQCLEVGPNLNPDIHGVLLRFRFNRIAWIADIEQAFLNITLPEDDAEAIRFLWYDDLTKPTTEPIPFKWLRVPFGLTSSPFLLRAVIRKHLKLFEESHPATVRQIASQLYVDDFPGGASNIEEARKTIDEAVHIFADAQMHLRKWLTNDRRLRAYLGEDGQAGSSGILTQALDSSTSSKVLGIKWDTMVDAFFFDPTAVIEAAEIERPTMRDVLRVSSRIFDPLGLIAPTVLLLKMIFQQLWEVCSGWDVSIPQNIQESWKTVMTELAALATLRIPRWIGTGPVGKDQEVELHVFGDASELAYGTVAYVRIRGQGDATTRILCSKTRVAPSPKKKVSLPRLELLASVLAARLAFSIIGAVDQRSWSVTLWSDSQVALAWIRGDVNKWKPFVRNRVNNIRQITRPEDWRFCPGKDNPADLASRGAPAGTLVTSSLWWDGPPWLQQEEEEWPDASRGDEAISDLVNEEAKMTVTAAAAVTQETAVEWNMDRISKFIRLVRRTAWILRFLNRLRNRQSSDLPVAMDPITFQQDGVEVEVLVPCLTAEEVVDAENAVYRQLQRERYRDIYEALTTTGKLKPKGNLRSLRPQWDARDKLIRVAGRIELALRDRAQEAPILLPADHRVMDLLIDATHRRLKHAGVRATLAELKERFWPVRGRQQVKRVLGKCVRCRKLQGSAFDEVAAPLPLDRTRQAVPFEVVGVDFAGPLYIQSRGAQQQEGQQRAEPEKVYVCLFTCAVTRAVHLELVRDLTAATFILAVRRFFARRGTTSIFYSDNAQTFQCAEKYLISLQADRNVNDWLANNRIEWRFSPSLAPWWGGFWERMVRSVKELLRKSIGRQMLDFDQMQTVLTEIEGGINDRPLTYVAEGVDEPYPLTPSLLLIGRRITTPPSKPAPVVTEDSATRTALIQGDKDRREQNAEWMWHWSKDYLQDLMRFHAKGRSGRVIRLGEAVVIHDANVKRLLWTSGVVVELIKGRDGRIRAAKVRTPGGTILERAIRCLYPMEVREDVQEEPEEENAEQPKQPEPPPTAEPVIDDEAAEEDDLFPAPQDVGNLFAPTRVTSSGRSVRLPPRYLD